MYYCYKVKIVFISMLSKKIRKEHYNIATLQHYNSRYVKIVTIANVKIKLNETKSWNLVSFEGKLQLQLCNINKKFLKIVETFINILFKFLYFFPDLLITSLPPWLKNTAQAPYSYHVSSDLKPIFFIRTWAYL